MKEMELYVHIPFCVRKCLYCDFLSGPADVSVVRAYMNRLFQECRTLGEEYREYEVSTVYLGGGTPSILEPMLIERLMDTLFQNFNIREDAEITMECNPGTITAAKARIMYRSGINRISLGLQSIHDGELKMLGRIHTFEDFLSSFEEARKTGFTNINVDIMYALPGQSAADWHKTIKQVTMLRPEHISAYSLMIEKGTPFYTLYHEDDLVREQGGDPVLLPSEEEEMKMYRDTVDFLGEHGYRRYEISNYARQGKECRHNIGYWTDKEYLGLGLGASSLIDNVRFHNTEDLSDYVNKPFARFDPKPRSRKEQMEEYMFLGLRMTDGISRLDFVRHFGVGPEAVYGNILVNLEREGLLTADEGRISLTPRGTDISNTVLAQLLL